MKHLKRIQALGILNSLLLEFPIGLHNFLPLCMAEIPLCFKFPRCASKSYLLLKLLPILFFFPSNSTIYPPFLIYPPSQDVLQGDARVELSLTLCSELSWYDPAFSFLFLLNRFSFDDAEPHCAKWAFQGLRLSQIQNRLCGVVEWGGFFCLITPSSLIMQENDHREHNNSSKYHQGMPHLHSFPTGNRAGLLEILFSAEQKSQSLENPPWSLQGRNPTSCTANTQRVLSILDLGTHRYLELLNLLVWLGCEEETLPALFFQAEIRRRGYIQPQWGNPASTRRWWRTWQIHRHTTSAASPGWKCRWTPCLRIPGWSGWFSSARCKCPQKPGKYNQVFVSLCGIYSPDIPGASNGTEVRSIYSYR